MTVKNGMWRESREAHTVSEMFPDSQVAEEFIGVETINQLVDRKWNNEPISLWL